MVSIDEINRQIQELKKSGINIDAISDGYHTFGEYKDMRNHWFISTLNSNPDISWKSKKHYDEKNDPMYNGDFIAGIKTPNGMASQNIKLKYWDLLNVKELDYAPKYDGYSEEDVKVRIMSIKRSK